MGIVFFILVGFAIWLAVLSVILFSMHRFFKKLTGEVNKGNLITILEAVLNREKVNSGDISEVRSEIKRVRDQGELHIQKVGFVRFNPFEELGGDHSFSVALLNGRDEGIIITGLHTRERTRVYVKDIKMGRSGVELSHEERKALRAAQKIT